MKLLRTHLWLAATLLLVVHPSTAQDLEMRVSCPARATLGSTIRTHLRFENQRCLPAEVRLSSSIAGNPLGNFGAIGIFGPVVVEPTITVPAGSGFFCTSPPGVTEVSLWTPPAIPTSLVGTVATFFLIAEWEDGPTGGTVVQECMADVVEPVCFGDLNGDGRVNNSDALLFRGDPGCFPCADDCNPSCDSNGDGIVNNLDVLAFRENFGRPCP